MAKRRLKKIQVYVDMYDAYVIFLIGGEVPDLLSYLKRKHGADNTYYSWSKPFTFGKDADTTDGYQFHTNAPLGRGEIFYSWHSDLTPNLLTHELYHIVGDILHTRGVAYSYGSEEIYAYLYGWIFERLFKKLGGKLPKRL